MAYEKIDVPVTYQRRIESKLDRVIKAVGKVSEPIEFSASSALDRDFSTIADKLVVKIVKFYQDYLKQNPDNWEAIYTTKFDKLEQSIYQIITKHNSIGETYFRELLAIHVATLPMLIHLEGLHKTPEQRQSWLAKLVEMVTKPAEFITVHSTVKRRVKC